LGCFPFSRLVVAGLGDGWPGDGFGDDGFTGGAVTDLAAAFTGGFLLGRLEASSSSAVASFENAIECITTQDE